MSPDDNDERPAPIVDSVVDRVEGDNSASAMPLDGASTKRKSVMTGTPSKGRILVAALGLALAPSGYLSQDFVGMFVQAR
jgi:hypothetical protein